MVKRIVIFMLISIICFVSLTAQAVDKPLPPNDVLDWFEYALKRYPIDDCPFINEQISTCAAVTEVVMKGNAKQGKLQVQFSGYNWSRIEQEVKLIGPSKSIALKNFKIGLSEQGDPDGYDAVFMAPYFDKSGYWKLKMPPGKFSLQAEIVFDPKSVVPFYLSDGIGTVHTADIEGGFLQYDENTGNHGGEVQLILSNKKQLNLEKPKIRVTRVFHWGNIPTFTYELSVSGVRTDTPIELFLLNDEIIESVSPQKSYKIEKVGDKRKLIATFTSGIGKLTFKGHFRNKPKRFEMNDWLPFEVWLYEANRRYPVNIETNANPIDPGEFTGLVYADNARAFVIKPKNYLVFHPIALVVDEGRKGNGKIEYEYFEGLEGYWLEKLNLTATILGQDRLVIPTPNQSTYAGIGGEGIELYHDKNNKLSVRLPSGGIQSDPIEVNWNHLRSASNFFRIFSSELPAQNVYLEEQKMHVYFNPDVVPIFAWGADETHGDLLDQFHLYGILIGIFAFFVCRGLKFSWVLSLLVTLLFVGLYLNPQFPTTLVLIMLVFTLPLVHLKDVFFEKLNERYIGKRLVCLVWMTLFLVCLVSLVNYGRARLFMAFASF